MVLHIHEVLVAREVLGDQHKADVAKAVGGKKVSNAQIFGIQSLTECVLML
jgi:hypothetical protein